MKSNIYFPGAELECVITEFYSPQDFYCSFTEENDYIKLSESNTNDTIGGPDKNEVVQDKKFAIRVGDENVLCKVLSDLKPGEVNCQVLLCNTSVKLKVNFQSLRHINSDSMDIENIITLKVHDFAPQFMNAWSKELIEKMKVELLFNRFMVQFKSNMPDPVDGRYPVELFYITDNTSVTDKFIDDKLAIRYSDYYQSWLNHETKRIFDYKDINNKKYIISAPMFKKSSSQTNNVILSPKHKFNIEAEPFTPNLSKCDIINKTQFNSDKSSVFSYDKLPGFANGTVFSNYSSSATDTSLSQSFVEKLTLLPRINKTTEVLTPCSESSVNLFNSTKRIKKGLDVVSPSSKRKATKFSVSCENTNYVSMESVHDQSMTQPFRAFFMAPNTNDHHNDTTVNDDAITASQSLTNIVSSPSDPSKPYGFNCPMPFVPLQQYSFSNMFMFPPPMPGPQITNRAYYNNVPVTVQRAITPTNVTVGQVILHNRSL